MKQAPTGQTDASGLRILILHTSFNARVVGGLLAGARVALRESGVKSDDIDEHELPGAFELPVAAQVAADAQRYDAIVALGAVIRGETDHYEHIAREAARGLMNVSLASRVPVALGVLTVREEAHAVSRSVPGPENKGGEAARAAVTAAAVIRALRSRRSR